MAEESICCQKSAEQAARIEFLEKALEQATQDDFKLEGESIYFADYERVMSAKTRPELAQYLAEREAAK